MRPRARSPSAWPRVRRAPTPPRSASSGPRSTGGSRAADELVPEVAGGLFGTEDLRGAVRSFLERGPGHATYEGR